MYAPKNFAPHWRMRHGQLLCTRCIELAVEINDGHVNSRGLIIPQKESAEFAGHLSTFVESEPDDPLRVGFLDHLNTSFNRLFMKLVDFEASLDLANKTNLGSNPAFATIRGDLGVATIVEIENREPPIELPPAEHTAVQPLVSNPILISEVRGNSAPHLLDISRGGTIDPFIEGTNRSEAAIAWAAGVFMGMREKCADEIIFLEYGPRLAIGALTLAARMGLNVLWREVSPQAYIHTSHQIEKLPAHLKERISFAPPNEPASAGIALWNMPWPSIGPYRMGSETERAGLVLIQSEKKQGMPIHFWTRPSITYLPLGESIFPSSFTHVIPRVFQVWQNFSR